MILNPNDVKAIKAKRPSQVTVEDMQNLIDTYDAMQRVIRGLREQVDFYTRTKVKGAEEREHAKG